MREKKYYVQTCCICIEGIQNDSICRILSCFHIYHINCIDEWLMKNASCPMCNKEFKNFKDTKIDFKEHEIFEINVDFEYFYSDRLISRIPDILNDVSHK